MALSRFGKLSIHGSGAEVTRVETILAGMTLPEREGEARLFIRRLIALYNWKATILYDGNTVWDKAKIIRNVKTVVKHSDMEKMSDYLYQFLSLACGSIAHYNKLGWINVYPTIGHLRGFFQRNEFGVRVLNHIPTWKTDAIEIVKEIEKILKIK